MDEVTRLILNDPQVQHECRIRSKAHALVWLGKRINRDPMSRSTVTTIYADHTGRGGKGVRLHTMGEVCASDPLGQRGQSLYARQVVGAKQFECNGIFSDSLAECFAIADFVRKLTDGENDSIF